MELIKQIDCAEAIYEALRTPMLKGTFTDTMSLAVSLVKEVPTIEAEPIRHGWWEKDDIKLGDDYGTVLVCSECDKINWGMVKWNYCPNCGAKMDDQEDKP